MTEIRLPEISGSTPAEQLRQLQSYLYTLASQLQFAFDAVEQGQQAIRQEAAAISRREKTPAETFSSLKTLIIKSADIVEKYAEEVERRLEGQYVAQSQFGTYRQETEQKIRENAQEILRSFRNAEELQSLVAGIQSALVEVNAYIRTGLLYDRPEGGGVYGVEIGQQETVDGVIRFRRFSRLTAEKLSFFDSNDNEVAFISDQQLHVTGAVIHRLSSWEMSADKLRLGEYLWERGADGHLTLS